MRRHLGVGETENILDGWCRHHLKPFDDVLNSVLATGKKFSLSLVVPKFLRDQVIAQPQNRVSFTPRFHFLRAAITARVIGGRVIAEAVSHGLDKRRASAGARAVERFVGHPVNGEQIVAVHLHAVEPEGERFLRDGLRGGLLLAGNGDGGESISFYGAESDVLGDLK